MTEIEIDTETALVATDIVNIDDIRFCGAFSGGADNRWSWSMATDTTLFTNNGGMALLISNGADSEVYYYEGHSGDTFKPSTDLGAVAAAGFDFSNFSSVEEIIEFWNHIFYLNYTDTAKNAKSLAYADFGDIDDWATGTSGSTMLTDSIGKIIRAKKLGTELVIYSSKSITLGRYLGTQILFAFPTMITETGLYAPKAIWDSVNNHYFLGTDLKIYSYTGGRQLDEIGLPIEDALFSEIDASKKNKIVMGVDAIRHKLYVLFAKASDTYAQNYYAWAYRSPLRPWEYGRFSHDVRDFSVFENARDWYCDDEDKKNLYCDDVEFYCDFAYAQLGNPIAIFISSEGYVYQMDERGSHADSDIEAVYDTEEVSIDGEYTYGYWLWFKFIARAGISSSTLKVYYCTSDDVDWTSWTELSDSPVSLNSTWTVHRIPIEPLDADTRKIKFRFYQKSQKDFQIRDPMHVEVGVGTPKD
jgi:hypothetical protein